MDLGGFISIGQLSVLQIITLASPVLLVAIGVGLFISILQAVTSIQEQTLTFVPKIIAILVVLIVFGPWMIGQMLTFTENLWRMLLRM